jgi:propionyl-CoA carboxylase beta chain
MPVISLRSCRRTTSTRRRFAEPADAAGAEDPELDSLIPDDPAKPYDMKQVISRVVDDGDFLEVHERWAENIVCCFARFNGYPVGVVGNQPRALRRVLDIDSSTKAARFVRNLRCVQHSAGHLRRRPGIPTRDRPGVGRIIRHGAKLLYASIARQL